MPAMQSLSLLLVLRMHDPVGRSQHTGAISMPLAVVAAASWTQAVAAELPSRTRTPCAGKLGSGASGGGGGEGGGGDGGGGGVGG